MRRPWPLAVLVLAAVATLGGPAPASGECLPAFAGHVVVDPSAPAVTGTSIGLALEFESNADSLVQGSIRFEVTRPDGTKATLEADRYQGATFSGSQLGRYTVVATWSRYECDGLSGGTTTGSTAPVSFDAIDGQPPKVQRFWIIKRPREHQFGGTQPGFAIVRAVVASPDKRVAAHGPVRVDIYWTTNGRPATHASKHVWREDRPPATEFGQATYTFSKDLNSKLVLGLGRGAALKVFEPARVDALIEVHFRDTLIGARRVVFRPSRNGESATLRPA